MNTTAVNIHRTAEIDPSAEIGAEVEIGPYCVVGPGCDVGDRTRLRRNVIIDRNTILGADNDVHPNVVLGGDPQDRKYDPAVPGRVIIGDRNILREGVTINRSVGDEKPTSLGSDCFLMACAHLGHNAVVEDRVVMANGAVLAGHTRVGESTFMSAYAGVHQYCVVGEFAMLQGLSAISSNVPPYVILSSYNVISGLNRVGLRRSGRFTDEDLAEIKQVYRIFFRGRESRTLTDAIRKAEDRSWRPAAQRLVDFMKSVQAAEPPFNRSVARARNKKDAVQ